MKYLFAKLKIVDGKKELPLVPEGKHNTVLLPLQKNNLMCIDIDQPKVDRKTVIDAITKYYKCFVLHKTGKGWHIILRCLEKHTTAQKQNLFGFYPVDILHNHNIIYKTLRKTLPQYIPDDKYNFDNFDIDDLDIYKPMKTKANDPDTESEDSFNDNSEDEDEDSEDEDSEDEFIESQEDDLEKLFNASQYDFSEHNTWVKLGTWIKYYYNKDKEGLDLWRSYCMNTLSNKQDRNEYNKCWKSLKKNKMSFFWIYKHLLQDIKNENVQVLTHRINEYRDFVSNKDFTYNLHELLRYIKQTFAVILDDSDTARIINVKGQLANYNYKKKGNDYHTFAKFRINGKVLGIYDILIKTPTYQPYLNTKYAVQFFPKGVPQKEFELSLNSFMGYKSQIADTSEGTEFIFDHIENVLCAGNKQFYNYYLEWLSTLILDERPTEICIVFEDPNTGSGKGRYHEFLINDVMGDYCSHRTEVGAFGGNFNSQVFDKMFICFDEATSKNKAHAKATWEIIKSFITDRRQGCKEKFKNEETKLFYGSFTWSLQSIEEAFLDEQDRRIAAITTKPRKFKDADDKADYWRPVTGYWDISISRHKDIGGRFMKGLQERRPHGVQLCDIPKTSARERLIGASLSSSIQYLKRLELWVKGKRDEPFLHYKGGNGFLIMPSEDRVDVKTLYVDYKDMVSFEGVKPQQYQNFLKDFKRYAQIKGDKHHNKYIVIDTIDTTKPRTDY